MIVKKSWKRRSVYKKTSDHLWSEATAALAICITTVKKFCKKKVGVGPDPKSNQFCPMPMGICCQICSQIGPPVLESLPGNHFLTFRSLWPWPLTSKQGWGHYFCGWHQHTIRWLPNSYGKVLKSAWRRQQKLSVLKLRCAVAKNYLNLNCYKKNLQELERNMHTWTW